MHLSFLRKKKKTYTKPIDLRFICYKHIWLEFDSIFSSLKETQNQKHNLHENSWISQHSKWPCFDFRLTSFYPTYICNIYTKFYWNIRTFFFSVNKDSNTTWHMIIKIFAQDILYLGIWHYQWGFWRKHFFLFNVIYHFFTKWYSLIFFNQKKNYRIYQTRWMQLKLPTS